MIKNEANLALFVDRDNQDPWRTILVFQPPKLILDQVELVHQVVLTETWRNCQYPYNEVVVQRRQYSPRRNWWIWEYVTCCYLESRSCIKLNDSFKIVFYQIRTNIYSLLNSYFMYLGARPAGMGERVGPPVSTSLFVLRRNESE